MIIFFKTQDNEFIAIESKQSFTNDTIQILEWCFSGAKIVEHQVINGTFIGPRKEMITPWSTNAVEIVQNCGIQNISRIEKFIPYDHNVAFDEMLQQKYIDLNQEIFKLDFQPKSIAYITDIEGFNNVEGLALSSDEIDYLYKVAKEINRPLTDSEIFGFSQINSEHCRHKIFNGIFEIDGKRQEKSLFEWIKKTTKDNPNFVISAYKDNVAFIKGTLLQQFAPSNQKEYSFFETSNFESVISLKAETHNFPTTVEPFNGAATGSGGEIRDRMAGGTGSIPLAGTAVYMTPYARIGKHKTWEQNVNERKWRYQKPVDLLIKSSNGASDFGNKFGQPLICGSLLTFEHTENNQTIGYDKVIMLAGGVGYAKFEHAVKKEVTPNLSVILLGGDNYRIGMGGGAVSSVDTGDFAHAIELNAVQRSNPEMQKRVANVIRALVEKAVNPIISIHDHGAGGHLNCLSELVENTGGKFYLEKFPIGDPTLSDKEILSNESQERMGLVIHSDDLPYLYEVARRERAPIYEVGQTTNDKILVFLNKNKDKPFELKLNHLFEKTPALILKDKTLPVHYQNVEFENIDFYKALENVLQLEAVACKDWLTNKVDRSVSGRVATQQTTGEIQLPLNNLGVMALDYQSLKGVATTLGHAPVLALIDPAVGSKLAVVKALTNISFAYLTHGLKGISLSANWMWPAKQPNENVRLYEAVKSLSEFCCDLQINVPTGKDSLSMVQKYPDGQNVMAPGTVIVSAVAQVENINYTLSPVINTNINNSTLYYLPFASLKFELGGSSFAQTQNKVGDTIFEINATKVKKAFTFFQLLVKEQIIEAGHDVSAGGLITTLLEMNFANASGGMEIDFSDFDENNLTKILFSELPAIVFQAEESKINSYLSNSNISCFPIGKVSKKREFSIINKKQNLNIDIDKYRNIWMNTSHLLDMYQTKKEFAILRYENYKNQKLYYRFPTNFEGTFKSYSINLQRNNITGIKAAIIREQGVNGDREMAYALWMAGFDVLDIHMTDLINGHTDLSHVQMIAFVGGFSNSDVLGSAKGWAGSFLFNQKAKKSLDDFYLRNDTLSLGVCNGCQLMVELGVVYPKIAHHPKMKHNKSGKYESAFINVEILENKTVMLNSLAGTRLGVHIAHGEGCFEIKGNENDYVIPMKFGYGDFPANPNGSDFNTAALASKDGRHLAMMPHLERSIFPWNWAYYENKKQHQVTPWIEAFINARKWIENFKK